MRKYRSINWEKGRANIMTEHTIKYINVSKCPMCPSSPAVMSYTLLSPPVWLTCQHHGIREWDEGPVRSPNGELTQFLKVSFLTLCPLTSSERGYEKWSERRKGGEWCKYFFGANCHSSVSTPSPKGHEVWGRYLLHFHLRGRTAEG